MSRAGYVYLLRSGDVYKIGRSSQPEVRAARVRGPGGRCELIHSFFADDSPMAEIVIHNHFSRKRIDGWGQEWFALTPSDVEWVRSLTVAPSRIDSISVAHLAEAEAVFRKAKDDFAKASRDSVRAAIRMASALRRMKKSREVIRCERRDLAAKGIPPAPPPAR
jgi:hypothetical protein